MVATEMMVIIDLANNQSMCGSQLYLDSKWMLWRKNILRWWWLWSAADEHDDDDDGDGIHAEYQRRIYILVNPPLEYPSGYHHVTEKIQARVQVQVCLNMAKNRHRYEVHFHFSENLVHSVWIWRSQFPEASSGVKIKSYPFPSAIS